MEQVVTAELGSDEDKIDVIVNLCQKLFSTYEGQEGWVSRYPEKAAAMMECIGLLEGEIHSELKMHMKRTNQFFVTFKTFDGAMIRSFVLCGEDRLEIVDDVDDEDDEENEDF